MTTRSILPHLFAKFMLLLSVSWLSACHSSSQDQEEDQRQRPLSKPGSAVSLLERSVRLGTTTYQYTVFVPPTWHVQQLWPILISLHDLGEQPLNKEQKSHGFAKMLQIATPPFPLVVVFPQCPFPHTWNEPAIQAMVVAMLQQTIQEFHGDQRRVYLFGHSMGGAGVWALASAHPELFAALVPVAGSVRVLAEAQCFAQSCTEASIAAAASTILGKIGSTPVWIFHGAKDPVFSVSETRAIVATLTARGEPVQYTEYAETGHRCWRKAYKDPALLPWVLAQHRSP